MRTGTTTRTTTTMGTTTRTDGPGRPAAQRRRARARRARRALLAAIAFAGTGFVPPSAGAADTDPTWQLVPKARCQPGDPVETGLQGQVPRADRESGRAARGYACNLRLVGRYPSDGFASFDTYGHCGYYSDNYGAVGTTADTGTVVLDLTDPTKPVRTDYLTARAMRDTGESLRVNARRGLLVADHYGNGHGDRRGNGSAYPWLAVYDVGTDCRHPKLLADVAMPHGRGHEGWVSPDGLTYFMSNYGSYAVVPIDLTDPAHPRELARWPYAVHGGSVSDDGTRAYLAGVRPGPNELRIVDTSDLGPGRPNAGRVVGRLPLPDTNFNQSSYPLDYRGHPYLISFGELPAAPHAPCSVPRRQNFDAARMVDLADEAHPAVVARFLNEVDDPANCEQVVGDFQRTTHNLDRSDLTYSVVAPALFQYDDHYCTPDRLHDPTILACAQIMSGLRVYDIRDPRHPKEIAYYNPGTLAAGDETVDWALARPVIRRDLGQIWFVTTFRGFQAVQFAPGVWPFPGTEPCPGRFDWLAAQYDPAYAACRAGTMP
ncbi:MAG TPA: hypothetical protein VHL53_05100 [Acidimicrobiia bacterium]|nr:hypothetical protein [Acidimicrobiia bacterium]